ncbi:hypothetical protein EHI8A_233530 [Entamoeba histolytica HM-1:IMSS-B]|uniref:TLDc domain-containing protein n=5 Tax=Entamoeba histolytica TaxID=5759 RepID=C4MA44_ENTH1|nr:hypothetical protein EHI_067080 [Entamoeba histolytica HM-1:IMSS]EMH78304.1 hypothetical protein EHI8A_233530 [Entamoeba histolytica HM-1:IMSS-B]EMS16530.1 hypothetical protein KM1_183130 [Entamoeba histolytica HM-3:IMSS]ENY60361.1 hypothetical protein EHI7A_108380 [Entamoeba histolytica HM-1:IMSS-A]GAT98624.1 hypothetical protein CL6EHI_067080 [Entamoeba histolytica]EAL43460.1 hypothetical protein EHI_067080 [Entamoeba histolytica HM-1:IMSS]|eukprot:XP_648847.1 hypothetical protein EHI_067080 [Entamoeba histolytica HM-1:IMSS]
MQETLKEEMKKMKDMMEQINFILSEIEINNKKRFEIQIDETNIIQRRIGMNHQLETMINNTQNIIKLKELSNEMNNIHKQLNESIKNIEKDFEITRERIEKEIKTIDNKCKDICDERMKEEEAKYILHQWNKGREMEIIYDSDINECSNERLKETIMNKGNILILFEGNEGNVFGISLENMKKDYSGIIMDKSMTFYGFKNKLGLLPKLWRNEEMKEIPKLFIHSNQNYILRFGGWNENINIGHLNKKESREELGWFINIPKQQFIGTKNEKFVVERIMILKC